MVVERDHLGFDAPAPLDHPARQSLPDGRDPGPALGDQLPDFTLPDAYGNAINFTEARAGRPAAIIFFRSAVW